MNFSFSELIFDQLIFGQLVWSSYPLKYMSEGGLAEVLGNKPEPGSLGTREVMSSLGSKIIIRVTYAPARLLLSQPPCLLSFLSLFISPFYPISLKQNPGSAECIIISTLHVGQDILSKAFCCSVSESVLDDSRIQILLHRLGEGQHHYSSTDIW